MASLIEDIIALEKQADETLQAAKTAAQRAEADVESEIAALRSELENGLAARIEEYRAGVRSTTEAALATAQAEHASAITALDAIPETAIAAQAAQIMSKFREA